MEFLQEKKLSWGADMLMGLVACLWDKLMHIEEQAAVYSCGLSFMWSFVKRG